MASYQLSENPTEGRDEETVQPSFGNKFANDGSFFEMFRKKMEDQQKAKDTQSQASAPASENRTECRTDQSSQRQEKGQKERTHAKPYQGITGKRKALMKTLELREKRKRRREEIEEQQNADEEAIKNSAWKAYLAEVKAYEERTCTDQDGHKRPLVK